MRCGRDWLARGPSSEPPIDLDTMIDLTAKASVNGARFDGIDIFHAAPHTNIDFTDDEVKRLAEKVQRHNLMIGSIVAPVWPPVGGGSAMGSAADRKKFVANVEKSCKLGARLRALGVRSYGVIRIDSAASPGEWAKDPAGNTKKIAKTFREACGVAADYRRAARRRRRNLLGRHALLEGHDRHARSRRTVPRPSAFRPTWRIRCSTPWATMRPKARLLPAKFDWKEQDDAGRSAEKDD